MHMVTRRRPKEGMISLEEGRNKVNDDDLEEGGKEGKRGGEGEGDMRTRRRWTLSTFDDGANSSAEGEDGR